MSSDVNGSYMEYFILCDCEILFCTLSFGIITMEGKSNPSTDCSPCFDFTRSVGMIIKNLETPEAILARFGIQYADKTS